MTFTVTLLGDHKGMTTPKVVGDEYVVDAALVFTVYHTADVLTASLLGLSSITSAVITGNSQGALYDAVLAATDSTGLYASGTTLKVLLLDNADANDAEVANTTNITDTTVRVRVWGSL